MGMEGQHDSDPNHGGNYIHNALTCHCLGHSVVGRGKQLPDAGCVLERTDGFFDPRSVDISRNVERVIRKQTIEPTKYNPPKISNL